MRKNAIIIAVILAGLCAFGTGAGSIFAVKAIRNGDLFFAHYKADDAIKAFNAAGLRTDNIRSIGPNAGNWGLNANQGHSFSPGVFPAVTFYIFEFHSATERNDAQDMLVNVQRNGGSIIRPNFFVRDNLIFVYNTSNSSVAARYETVLAGMR